MRTPILLLLAVLTALISAAQETVPVLRLTHAPSPDAVVSDWPAGQMYPARSESGSAWMRFGADARAFYAYVQVTDPSPLRNGAASPPEVLGGGDVLAFYFQIGDTAPQRLTIARRGDKLETTVFREKSAVKRPYTFTSPAAESAFDFVGPVDATVGHSSDAEGYTIELALPWASLGLDTAPERFAFDAQVLFSDPGGTQTLGMCWLIGRDSPGATIEDLPTMARLYPDTWGQAVVTDKPDELQTTIGQAAEPPPAATIAIDLPRAGKLSLNITDADGWIIRELVRAQPVQAGPQTIGWDGRDRYGEPLPPGDYQWRALLFDGMRTHFMGSVGNSGRPPYRTPDGLGSMGGQHGQHKSVAADPSGVYLANALQEGPPIMRKVDHSTGAAIWTRSAGGFGAIDAIAADEGMVAIANSLGKRRDNATHLIRLDPATGQPLAMGDAGDAYRIPDADDFYDVHGLAIVGGIAWYALPEHNRIGGIDLRSGAVQPPIELVAPMGLGRQDARTLLACSADKLIAIDIQTRETRVVLEGLDTPRAVTVDAQGRYLISLLGKTQQVIRYDAQGRLLATFGEGGEKPRQQNPYQPMAFRNIIALAVAPDGNLWLGEAHALTRRVIRLSPDGAWLEDIYGPVAYNAFGPDLDDFGRVYYTITGGCFIETRVDYDAYRAHPERPYDAWHIVRIHDMSLAADGETRNELMLEVAKTGYGHVIAFRAENGERYFFRLSKHNRAKVPPGAGIWIERDGRWVPSAFISRDDKKQPSWADRNGDGIIQDDETYTGLPIKDAAWLDRDLTLHGYEGQLSPASFTESGAPVYADGPFRPYLAEGEPSHKGNQWTFFSPGYDDPDGEGQTVYYISNHGQHRHLSFWDRATENRLIKIQDGRVQWIAGEHAARPDLTQFSTNSGIAGAIDGVVLVQNIEPANYIAYTDDGFVLGDIMVGPDGKHPKVGPFVINIESFTGLYVKDPASGRNVLFAVSSGDDRILEVTGPGQTTRLSGSVSLDTPTFYGAGPTAPYSTWWGNTARDMGTDATDAEWRPEVKPWTIFSYGRDGIADLRFRRDAGALHIFANVLDPDVDGSRLHLRFSRPETETPADAPTVYSLELRLTPGDDGKIATDIIYFAGQELQASAAEQIEIKAAPRWRGYGYRVEVAIPLALMPELSADREQSYRRPKDRKLATHTAVLPDLVGPIDIRVSFHTDGISTGPVHTHRLDLTSPNAE